MRCCDPGLWAASRQVLQAFFCFGVQSASICHWLTTVPLGAVGLILQSISRRAAFVLSWAPMGPICFTMSSLHFYASRFLSHSFVDGSVSLWFVIFHPFVSLFFLFAFFLHLLCQQYSAHLSVVRFPPRHRFIDVLRVCLPYFSSQATFAR